MHLSGLLPLTFEGPAQGFAGENCQSASKGKPCYYSNWYFFTVPLCLFILFSMKSCFVLSLHVINPYLLPWEGCVP